MTVSDRRTSSARWLLAGLVGIGVASDARADLSGASHTLRAPNFPVTASAPLIGATSGVESRSSAGQAEPIGLAGDGSDLSTLAPGFWPIVRGDLPGLDADGDELPWYAEDDDDGDGLSDDVETNTGVFASATDTGTNPFVVDTDADGWDDGVEVMFASDPTDPESIPGSGSPLPATRAPWLVLSLLLAAVCVFGRLRRAVA